MQCPYCHNIIKDFEFCLICGEPMIFVPEEGPFGTWECRICSTEKYIVGFRTSINGLVRAQDSVGRYKVPEPDTSNEKNKSKEIKIDRVANELSKDF